MHSGVKGRVRPLLLGATLALAWELNGVSFILLTGITPPLLARVGQEEGSSSAPQERQTTPRQAAESYAQGLEWLRRGSCRRALPLLQQASSHDPDLTEAFYPLSACLAQLGKAEEAFDGLLRLLKKRPGDVRAYSALAVLYYHSGDQDTALRTADRILQMAPETALAYGVQGTVYMVREEFDKALPRFQRLAELARREEDQRYAQFGLGNVYLRTKHFEEAWQAYKKALRLRSPARAGGFLELPLVHEPLLTALLKLGLGQSLFHLGRWKEAVSSLEEAIQMNGALANDESLVNLGISLAKTGRWKRALKTFRKAAHSNPGSAKAHHWQGVAESWLGKLPQALDSFGRAVALKPDSTESLYFLGVTQAKLGRKDQALKQYGALKELDATLAKQLLKLIQGKSP